MVKRICLYFCLYIICFATVAQTNYAVSLIPASLLENANLVKRQELMRLDIKANNKAVVEVSYALTIMNEAGDDFAQFSENYSKLISIKSVEGTLYDASGRKLRSTKKSDFKDFSDTDESSFADDSRIRVHSFYHRVYPYTVEYSYELHFDGLFFLPAWIPVEAPNMSVVASRLDVFAASDYNLRYKLFGSSQEPVLTDKNGNRIYSWQVSNLPALVQEPFMNAWYENTVSVFLAPSTFSFQGYDGNMSNWQSFGKFFYELNAGRDKVPDAVGDKIRGLVSGEQDMYRKVEKIYNYVQQSTRYISIQLGLGGWQTFDAQYVATKGYGDCKALTNYMHSLLKEVGIPSKVALLRAGRRSNDIITDFPSNQFNHIILCVPGKSDSIWIECTSSTLPAGYLGDFTSNRHALLIDETGGYLVRTPDYRESQNLQARKMSAVLHADGKLDLQCTTVYEAEKFDEVQSVMSIGSAAKRQEALKEGLPFTTVEIKKAEYRELKNKQPAVIEELDLTVPVFSNSSGKRMFFTPNLLSRSSLKLPEKHTRKYPFRLLGAFTESDTVQIKIPDGFSPEVNPEPVKLQSPYGSYQSKVSIIGNQLLYVRSFSRKSGVFPPNEYPALAIFLNKVYKADRESVVLVKKD